VDADVDSQQGMCVLPSLAFDDEISFGDVTIAGWSRVEGNLERDVRTTAAQILAGFRDVRGNAVEPSLCWFSERDPTSPLAEEDVEILRDYIQLAALSALASNRYLSHREQINATHFARIYQNFLPGTETIALVRRRRDGSTTSAGWRLSELVFTAPAAAAQRPMPSFDRAFLDALGTCVGANDDTSTAIRESLTLFLQGSELDEYETHGQDVVWIASAIEQLCEVSGRNKDTQIAERMTAALGDAWNAQEKRTLRQWMREFYAKRSEIHGQEATTSQWPYWAHALLGTVSYIALVKHALAADSRYVLTDGDREDAAALPHRIDCLRDADTKRQDEFARCWGQASWEGAMARIFQRFGLQR
jgi:hypothetical protein